MPIAINTSRLLKHTTFCLSDNKNVLNKKLELNNSSTTTTHEPPVAVGIYVHDFAHDSYQYSVHTTTHLRCRSA